MYKETINVLEKSAGEQTAGSELRSPPMKPLALQIQATSVTGQPVVVRALMTGTCCNGAVSSSVNGIVGWKTGALGRKEDGTEDTTYSTHWNTGQVLGQNERCG